MAAQRSARRAEDVRQTAFGRYERETEWEPDGEASEFADLVGAEIHLAQNRPCERGVPTESSKPSWARYSKAIQSFLTLARLGVSALWVAQ
jgi:hypothetical protein